MKVRKKVVDARYLETSVPASTAAPFEVAADARCVPVNRLVDVKEQPDGYVIIGAGKTALDACCWLLDNGVPPDDLRWVKPREAWFLNRAFSQGGELVGTLLEGLALQVEAAAQATSVEDLFERLERTGQLLRIDQRVTPTMFRGPTVSEGEVAQLRQIAGTVRLGKLRRIEASELVFDEGRVPTSPRHLHVHCAAPGLNPAPAVPIFTEGTITLQSIRTGLIPFNAALIGFVEARREDVAEKNRLCPPNRQPNTPLDWLRGTLNGLQADAMWGKEPDIAQWLEASRLNTGRGLRARAKDPALQGAWGRFAKNARPGVANLKHLLES